MVKLPSGKKTHNYGKIHHFFMGKLTISMAMASSSQTVDITGRPVHFPLANPMSYTIQPLGLQLKAEPPNEIKLTLQ